MTPFVNIAVASFATDLPSRGWQHTDMTATSLLNQLRAWREYKRLSVKEAAGRLNTDRTQVWRLERGQRRLTTTWLSRFAQIYGVSESALLAPPPLWTPPSPPLDQVEPDPGAAEIDARAGDIIRVGADQYACIPVYEVQASAGDGVEIPPEPGILHLILFRLTWIKRLTSTTLANLAIFKVVGESMRPTLEDGDNVLIDISQREIGRGASGLFVVNLEGQAKIKRLARHPRDGTLSMKSDNPIYETFDGLSDEDVPIVGRVLWIGRTAR